MLESRVMKFAAFAVLWAGIGFVLTLEVFFNIRVQQPDVALWDVVVPQYARALFWAVLAPLVLRLRVRVPLHAGRWVGGVLFHLVVSCAVMAAYYLARILVVVLQAGEPLGEFWHMAASAFFGRNLIDVVFYWAVLGCGYGAEIYRRYKNEELKAAQLESRLMETELKALKQQLHPHFLFNTLNTISVLVRERRNDDAVLLLARLSALLRLSLDRGRQHEVTLQQEMDFLQRYLEIQQVRFADRLTVRTDISAAALPARIPNMLLQPLVENAVLHGIAPKEEGGTVEVTGRIEGTNLVLRVSDDGVGLPAAVPGVRRREGIGLANTRERLAKLYGARQRLELRSPPGGGTAVEITLPCRL